MTVFEYWPALAGGLLIGGASVWLLAANGRMAGVSGILHELVAERSDVAWRALFIVGLFAAGVIWLWLYPGAFVARTSPSLGALAAAGLLVGFGTRMSKGCTSGHGVCGLGRLSLRSLVAVATFLATGFVATYVMRHVFGAGL